ncbi:MAG: hypothetical protein HY716_01900 [Planctomycetes bacterium]|nr:hypothetical protein [Planctomycetota bacterium]
MVESSIIPNDELIEASAGVVAVASVAGREHGSLETVVNGRRVSRCKVYRNLTCDDHERASAVGLKFLTSGFFEIPTVIWCDPAGKEMFRRGGSDVREGSLKVYCKQIIKDLHRAVEATPGQQRSRAEYEVQGLPLEEGEAAMTERRWKVAVDKLTQAKHGPFATLTKAAEEKLDQIRRIGDRLLQEAQAYLEVSEEENARERLQLLSGEFIALDCGKKAADLLKALDEKQAKKKE